MSRNYHSILNVLSPSFPNTYSLAFDGVDDFIGLGSSTGLNFSGDFTLSAWVKTDSIGNDQFIVDTSTSSSFGSGYSFRIRTNGKIRFWSYSASSTGLDSATTLSADTWYHITCIHTSTQNKIYINGVLDGTLNWTTGHSQSNTTNLRIGGSSVLNGYFDGNIDEVAFWNSDQSANIDSIYSATGAVDLTSLNPTAWYRNGDNGSYKSPQWLIPSNENKDKVSNYSFEFDGVDDYVELGSLPNLQNATEYSISSWFKSPFNNQRQAIYSWADGADGYLQLLLVDDGSFVVYNYNTSAARGVTASGIVSADTWYNATVVFDGSGATNADRLKLYINGNLITLTYTGTIPTQTGTMLHNIMQLGASNSFNFWGLEGNIDEVSIFDSAISIGDVWDGSGEPIDVSTVSGLKQYYKMGEEANFTDNWLVNNSALSNYSTRSFNFDGVDDYISFSSITLSAEFTISAWIKPTNLGSNTSHIISTGTSNSNRIGIYTADTLQIKLGGSNVYLSESGGNDFVQDVWQHVLIVRDNSNNITAFRNGASFGTSVSNSNTGTLDSIFRFNNTTYSSGNLDEVAIWQSDKSSDVATIYSSGTPADLTSLSPVSWWRMGEDATFNTNWSLPDNGSASNTGTSANMTIADLEGDAPNYTGGGLSANMTIEDRVGDAPNSTSNALSYNMTESDRETDVPS